jgi:transposase
MTRGPLSLHQGTLKSFLRLVQNEFDLRIKKIISDNNRKFKNLQVEEYLEEEGIKNEFFAPYTPQQNAWWKGRTEWSSTWRGQCLENTRCWIAFGQKLSTQLATP